MNKIFKIIISIFYIPTAVASFLFFLGMGSLALFCFLMDDLLQYLKQRRAKNKMQKVIP